MAIVATQRPSLFRPDSPLTYAIGFIFYLSVVVRVVLRSPQEGLVPASVYGLLAAYLGLSLAHPPISRRWPPWTHIHLVVLCAIVCALLLSSPRLDYYAILFIAPSMIAAGSLPPRTDIAWLVAICVILSLALVAAFGPWIAASFIPIYIAGPLVMGVAVRESRKAEAARAQSEDLLERLSEANRRLREYAEQAEEAAAAQERARLARDLHDAATQTVFSMNLTAEAARMALDQDPGRARGMLDRIQELARDALGEMRSLVDQLRPQSIEDIGLVRALERHLAMRERRDGLKVTLSVEGEEHGESAVRDALFRSAREGLSNVLKHAGVSEAAVLLRFEARDAFLSVSDAGRGFDPGAELRPDSFGLVGLRERVAALRGSMEIRSERGKGTELEVRLPLGGGTECRENQGSPYGSTRPAKTPSA